MQSSCSLINRTQTKYFPSFLWVLTTELLMPRNRPHEMLISCFCISFSLYYPKGGYLYKWRWLEIKLSSVWLTWSSRVCRKLVYPWCNSSRAAQAMSYTHCMRGSAHASRSCWPEVGNKDEIFTKYISAILHPFKVYLTLSLQMKAIEAAQILENAFIVLGCLSSGLNFRLFTIMFLWAA